MPKGKKKGKYEHRRTEIQYSSDEDAGIDMTIDNCSEFSGQSDLKSNQDDVENEQEKFEEKVLEIIDSLSARSNAARANALVSLRSAMQRRYLASLLSNHRVTLADHVSKMLRRGRDGEKKAAAGIAPLLAVQIGEEGIEEYMAEIRPALAATAIDKSASIEARCESCSALAVLCYLFEEDISEILDIMRMYETIFSGSYLKGDGSVKVSGAAISEGSLHAHALDGWALLLTTVPESHARSLLNAGAPGIGRLAQLTHATDLDVRMAAGCALAIAHEHITDEDNDIFATHIDQFLPHLEDLARDSHKYRAKKDRKVQRATFRDVLKYFEDGTVTSESVKLGRESVLVEGWSARAAYGALAAALGGSLPVSALHCPALRAALRMPAVRQDGPVVKLNKLQRHLQNTAACKARTLVRNKNRDKRSAALAL